MIRAINNNYNTFASVKPSNNQATATRIIVDSLSFQGKIPLKDIKEMVKPTFINPKDVSKLSQKFSDGVYSLYESKNLNSKTAKALISETVPNLRIELKNLNELSTFLNGYSGFTLQKHKFGLKTTQVKLVFKYLTSQNIDDRKDATDTLVHEMTHALRFNTKQGAKHRIKIKEDRKFSKLYNITQDKLDDDIIYNKWQNAKIDGKKTKILDKLLDYSLNYCRISGKKETLSKLKLLHFSIMSEAEAYKNGQLLRDKIEQETEPLTVASYQIYEDFAQAIKRRYAKEGGNPSKLIF